MCTKFLAGMKNSTTTLKYQIVSFGIMNTQINLRLPDLFLKKAISYAEKNGYSNVQELIKETLREKLFDDTNISAKELQLVEKLHEVSSKKGLFGTEEELFNKLRKK